MSKQKAAEYILFVFTKTFSKPGDIQKAFRPALRKIILHLEKGTLCPDELDNRMAQLATDIWGQMHHISLDIVRCRVTDDVMSWYYELENGINEEAKNKYFEEITFDLMKALISIVSAEKKQALKTFAPGPIQNITPPLAG